MMTLLGAHWVHHQVHFPWMASSSYDLGETTDASRVAMWTKGANATGSLEGFLMDLLIVLIEQNPNNNLEIFILRYLYKKLFQGHQLY